MPVVFVSENSNLATHCERVIVKRNGQRQAHKRRRKWQNRFRRRNSRRRSARGNRNTETIASVCDSQADSDLGRRCHSHSAASQAQGKRSNLKAPECWKYPLHISRGPQAYPENLRSTVKFLAGDQFVAVGVHGNRKRNHILKRAIDFCAHLVNLVKRLRLVVPVLVRDLIAQRGNLLSGCGKRMRRSGAIERQEPDSQQRRAPDPPTPAAAPSWIAGWGNAHASDRDGFMQQHGIEQPCSRVSLFHGEARIAAGRIPRRKP